MKKVWCGFEFGDKQFYNDLGGSPTFLIELEKWLAFFGNQISTINIALYLFNNAELYKILRKHADCGCNVTIYSIPLEGYDNDREVQVFRHKNNTSIGCKTKFDLAKELYRQIASDKHPNIQLRIVPHMYLRSSKVKPFSRGNMPYSLHCKTLYVELKDGTAFAGLTSSNLAVRDAQKYEIAMITQLEACEAASALDFFIGLHDNSIDYSAFDEGADYTHFSIKMRPAPPASNVMYIAPFYRDSASRFEEDICSIIKTARRRILICAQHICAYDYTYQKAFTAYGAKEGYIKKAGFLNEVLQKAKEGIPTEFLSQTYVDTNGSHGCRVPQNKDSFIKFVSAAQTSNCHYFVNSNIHCKFIVVDDTVLITTCNFTPTQFIYLPAVSIERFEDSRMRGFSYTGIHCEIGAYSIVHSHEFAENIIKGFEILKAQRGSIRMF